MVVITCTMVQYICDIMYPILIIGTENMTKYTRCIFNNRTNMN